MPAGLRPKGLRNPGAPRSPGDVEVCSLRHRTSMIHVALRVREPSKLTWTSIAEGPPAPWRVFFPPSCSERADDQGAVLQQAIAMRDADIGLLSITATQAPPTESTGLAVIARQFREWSCGSSFVSSGRWCSGAAGQWLHSHPACETVRRSMPAKMRFLHEPGRITIERQEKAGQRRCARFTNWLRFSKMYQAQPARSGRKQRRSPTRPRFRRSPGKCPT
jgi:hypothetical protein